jgi:anaerobic selenocysteine-containing dehydrogenase
MVRLNRRAFLKGSSLGLLVGQVGHMFIAHAEVTQTDFGFEHKVPFMCRMCDQFCPALGVVRDGRLVRIESNKNTPFPGVCGRSRAAIGALYNPDRIRYPLLRVGARGKGEFQRISWDEALNRIAEKLRSLRDEGQAKLVSYLPRFHSGPGIDEEFFEVYGTPNIISYGDTCWAGGTSLGFAGIVGGPKMHGVPILGPGAIQPDYENAEYALLVGRNPGGGIVTYPWGVMFGRGKRNGLRVTVVDPRKPSEAGESDAHWIPIKPGTDAAFLLGLLHVMLKKGFYDKEYLREHTNAPMLVDVSTLQPVWLQGEPGSMDYLVYDEASRGFIPSSESSRPGLLGAYEFEKEGRKVVCKTSLQMLMDASIPFSPEWAEKVCTVPAKQIEEVAEDINRFRPKVVLDRGYRSERYYSSLREKITLAMLSLLTGSFGQEGGLYWQKPCGLGKFIRPPEPEEEPIISYYLENDPGWIFANPVEYRRTYFKSLLEEKPYRSRVAVIHGQNVIGGSAGTMEAAQALDKLELIVSISPYFDETTMFADIVLPDATYMERDEALSTKFKAPIATIGVNRKAVEPLFEARDGYWIFTQLAKRVLSEEEYKTYFAAFEEGGISAIWRKQYEGIKGLTEEERETLPSLDFLLEQGVWTGKTRLYRPLAMGTPTGKLELYSLLFAEAYQKLKELAYPYLDHVSPVPAWTPPRYMIVWPKLEKNEFIPVTGFFPLNTFTGAQTRNNELIKYFAAQFQADAVFINAAKAKTLGLKDGDLVALYNTVDPARKNARAIVHLTELVHPEAIFSFYCFTSGTHERLARQLRNTPSFGLNLNNLNDLGFNPITAGHPSQDFVIRVERVG